MKPQLSLIPIEAFLEYEIHSAWWAGYISHPVLQDWTGSYFAWKVKRKYRRYQNSIKDRAKYLQWKNTNPPTDWNVLPIYIYERNDC